MEATASGPRDANPPERCDLIETLGQAESGGREFAKNAVDGGELRHMGAQEGMQFLDLGAGG